MNQQVLNKSVTDLTWFTVIIVFYVTQQEQICWRATVAAKTESATRNKGRDYVVEKQWKSPRSGSNTTRDKI